MLVHSIVTKNLHTVQMNHIQHNSEVKNKNITSQNPDTTALPSYSAVRSYTNISFKGACELTKAVIYDEVNNLNKELAKTGINSENKYDTAIIATGRWRSIQCFKELRKHPEIDIYAENIDGWMCFTYACLWNCKYIIQDLCDDPNFDVNYQSKKTGDNGLIVACRNGKEEAVDIILQCDDVDLTLRNKENQSAFDCAKKYPSILKKLKNYEAKQKKWKEQEKAKQTELNIDKFAPKGEIWTDEERQTIAKLIENKDYAVIINLLEEKGVKFNKEYEQFKKYTAQLTETTKKEVRETETEKIRKEEREAAEQMLAQKQENLDKQLEAARKKETTFDNLIGKTQTIIADGIEDAKNGFRELYNIKTEELPQNMDFEEQKIWVLNVLATRQEKLKDTNKSTPNNITKAIQDDKGNISLDGLNFLERILDVSSKTFSEKNLLDSIASVKGNHGIFDMKKAAMFVSNISWKDNTISDVIKMVKNYKVKNLA